MLSRLALMAGRSSVRAMAVVRPPCTSVAAFHSSPRLASEDEPGSNSPKVWEIMPHYPDAPDLSIPTEKYPGSKPGPERDLVNFPNPRMRAYPPPTRFFFIPYSWLTFFEPKTGVSGPYVFGAGLITFLMSKEIWVIEHDFWIGIHLAAIFIFVRYKYGDQILAYLQAINDKENEAVMTNKPKQIAALEEGIEMEKKAQWQAQGQQMLFQAKRENVALQLEAAYRERQMTVYKEVKRRLDYQVEVQNSEGRIRHQHMINWIVNQVNAALTPEMEKATMRQCLTDLKGLAASQ